MPESGDGTASRGGSRLLLENELGLGGSSDSRGIGDESDSTVLSLDSLSFLGRLPDLLDLVLPECVEFFTLPFLNSLKRLLRCFCNSSEGPFASLFDLRFCCWFGAVILAVA